MLGDSQGVYVWKPSPSTFDQITVYECSEYFCEVVKQSSLPLELSSPIFDLAGRYAPLVILTEIPGEHNNNEPLNQIMFYQHIDVCDLGAMLKSLLELEPGWKIEGFSIVSPKVSSLSSTDVRRIANENLNPKRLQSSPIEESSVSSVNVSWKPILFGLTCFALGCLSSLLIW